MCFHYSIILLFNYFRGLKQILFVFIKMTTAQQRIDKWLRDGNPKKWLNLSNLQLTELPPLAPTVRRLNCGNNKLTHLTNIPPSLQYLKCDRNYLVQFPSGLPTSLVFVHCADNTTLVNIDELPDSVTYINMFACEGVQHILKLPSDLRILWFGFAFTLKEIREFPPKLISVRIMESQLVSLPILPLTLKELVVVQSCLTTLPELPHSLLYLDVPGNNLTELPSLPPNIICVSIQANCMLRELGTIPDSVKQLDTDIPGLSFRKDSYSYYYSFI
jgi:Leucine-rich repeat (LRR) protein